MQIETNYAKARIIQGALHSELDAELENLRDADAERDNTDDLVEATLLTATISETHARIQALIETIEEIDSILENDN